jgi:hypothetical protein
VPSLLLSLLVPVTGLFVSLAWIMRISSALVEPQRIAFALIEACRFVAASLLVI